MRDGGTDLWPSEARYLCPQLAQIWEEEFTLQPKRIAQLSNFCYQMPQTEQRERKKTCHSSMTYSRNYTHNSSPRLRTQSYGWIQFKRGSEINLSLRNVRLSFAEKWIDRQEQWNVHHTGGKKQWIPRKVISSSTSGLWMDYWAL